MTTRQCQDSYFQELGVLKKIPLAQDGTRTHIDVCSEDWISWWMCQCPECAGPTKVGWLLLGLALKAAATCLNCFPPEVGQTCFNELAGTCLPVPTCDSKAPCSIMDGYSQLIQELHLISLLELAEQDESFLLLSLSQMETGLTESWAEFDSPEVTRLTAAQIRLVWLRHVAVSLYNELHCRFPWSIRQYSSENLRILLKWTPVIIEVKPDPFDSENLFVKPHGQFAHFNGVELAFTATHGFDYGVVCDSDLAPIGEECYTFYYYWNTNPLRCQTLIDSILSKTVIVSPLHALCESLEPQLRNSVEFMGWSGCPNPYHRCIFPKWWSMDIPEFFVGGCHHKSSMFRILSTGWNIPCRQFQGPDTHFGALWPGLGMIVLSGDDLIGNGSPTVNMPAKHLFLSVDWVAQQLQAGCASLYDVLDRRRMIEWMSYCSAPVYSKLLKQNFFEQKNQWAASSQMAKLRTYCGQDYAPFNAYLEVKKAVEDAYNTLYP